MVKLGSKTIIGAGAIFNGKITNARVIEINGKMNADLTADKVTIGEAGIERAFFFPCDVFPCFCHGSCLSLEGYQCFGVLHRFLSGLCQPLTLSVQIICAVGFFRPSCGRQEVR